MIIRQLTLAAIAAVVSCASFAQSAVHYREGQRVDPLDVAQILGSVAAAPRVKTRSIRLLDNDAVQNTVAAAADAGPSTLSLPVHFAFDSADIAADARPQLDALAQGIKMLTSNQSVLIEGHTDATGSHDYNQRLSQRRALAVKDYLVRGHGIDGARLRTAGVGEVQPIEGADPFDGRNRRVQFSGG